MNPEQLPLRDLHLPDPVGWWPLAPGWWMLIALVACAMLWLALKGWRRYRHNASRRLAIRKLAEIQKEFTAGVDAVTLGRQLSELTRRAMLAYAPRGEVAGLTGDAWLQWLDRGLEGKPFSEGPGRTLESLPYRRRDSSETGADLGALIDAIRLRLRTPLPGSID